MSVETAVYEQGHRRAEQVPLEDTYEQLREDGVFAWIGLYEPTEEEFDSVRREFNLHELAVEDAIQAHQRPKLEFYGDSLFMVLKTARWIDGEETIGFGEIQVFVGEGFIVSVWHGDTELHEVRLEMEQRPDLLAHGPSAALYAIVDRVVDDYAPVLDELDNAIRVTETEVFSPSRSNPAERIYQLKRAVLDLHAVVMPLVPELETLASVERPLIDAEMLPYFRDIHDHLVRASVQVHGLPRVADERADRESDPGERASERGRPEDLRVGGDHRRADCDRRHLRDELRAHARAQVEIRLSACARADRDHLLDAVQAVSARRLVVATDGRTPSARTWPRASARSPRVPSPLRPPATG